MDRVAKSSSERARAPASEAASGQSTSAALVDHSPRGAEMRALRDLMRHGPAAVAQRQRLAAMFGPASQPGGGDQRRRGGAPASDGDRGRLGAHADVAQLKLYVIGEDHQESGARRKEEKKYCAERYGGPYYLEHKYKMPNKEFPADPSATRYVHSALWSFDYVIYLFGSINYIIEDIDEKSDDLDKDKNTAIDEANVAIKELTQGEHDFIDLEHLGEERDEFKDDAKISTEIHDSSTEILSLLNECINILKGIKHDEKDRNSLNNIAKKIDDITSPLITAISKSRTPISLKNSDADKSVGDAEIDSNRRRSEGMAIALIKTDDSVNGAWKVGENHLDQIAEYIGDEKKSRKYRGNKNGSDFADQLISRETFNGEFRKWIAK